MSHRLRDDARKDSNVISHLKAENEYTRAVLADTEALQVPAGGHEHHTHRWKLSLRLSCLFNKVISTLAAAVTSEDWLGH
jgi:hypothetical protein